MQLERKVPRYVERKNLKVDDQARVIVEEVRIEYSYMECTDSEYEMAYKMCRLMPEPLAG